MPIAENQALFWVEKIIAVATLLQSIELLQLRKLTTPGGVWDWEVIKRDFAVFPLHIQRFLNLLLKHPHFQVLLLLRGFASIALLFLPHHPVFVLFLLISTLLISLRWRGTFNGGSDSMTLIVLTALSLSSIFPESSKIQVGALWYITLQTCSSYFIAGLVKIKQQSWRSGHALTEFTQSTIYAPSPWISTLFKNHTLVFITSWAIMVFELLFPISLLSSQISSIFIILAFLFHTANFYLFGLNRFLFAWAATYPALYYCSSL